MRKLTISLLAGATVLAASGAALAQDRPARDADMSRSAAEQRAAEAFRRMDANCDGKVDAADREARHKAHFDRIDADGDGSLSYAEFAAMHGKQGGERAGRSGKHDGPRMGMRGMRGGHAMGMRGMTEAEDGTLTQAEFTAAALARFDAADADRNGTLTAAERKAQRDQMRSQWRERRGQQG
jgi:Ca2+-binding EF-hand superfamily protein